MPPDDGFIVFPGRFDVVVLIELLRDSLDARAFFLGLLAGFDGDVDVSDFVVHLGHEVDTGDFGDYGKRGRVVESRVHEWGAPLHSSVLVCMDEVRALAWKVDLLWGISSDLTSGEIALDAILGHDLCIQHLVSEFLDGF